MTSCRRVLLCAALGALLLAPFLPAAAQDSAETQVSHHVVESFDGTPIVANLFLPPGASADNPVPLVLETHGWGGSGRTAPGGLPERLLDEGYAVLTWDQRGFGCSGGRVKIIDPDVEGRDVSALIDWVTANAPVQHRDGDPVIGMIGGSYAGGIQTATAATDPRVDAIAPEISWGDLRHSLYPGEVVKQGWGLLLYGAGIAAADGDGLSPDCPAGPQTGGLHPAIHQAFTEFGARGAFSEPTLDFFAKSSLAHYGQQRPVTVPTLVANGSVDTLFDVTDGLTVHEHALAQGADSRYVVFCGGHVSCPAAYEDAGDSERVRDAVVAWFARHLKGEDVDTGSRFEYRTNEGVWRSLDAFPTVADGAVTVAGEASDLLVVPIFDVPDVATAIGEFQSTGGTLAANPLIAASASAPGDPRAAVFEVAAAPDGPLEVVGIPEVSLTVSGQLLESLGELPDDELQPVLDQLALEGLQPVTDASGEMVGAAPMGGGLLEGLLGALPGLRVGDAVPRDAHLFVKLVHRETGHVLNLQQGAVRVPITEGPVEATVPMPGLAYTVPEGDHLDLEVSTTALTHATGRAPAVLDVRVEAAVPVVTQAADPPAPAPPLPSAPPPPADLVPGTALPATGAGAAALGAGLLLAGLTLRRIRA